MTEYKLPRRHAFDWFDRCGDQFGARIVAESERTITLDLSPSAVADLRADAEHYVATMDPSWTGGEDYRPAARRCLQALDRSQQH